MEAQKNKTLPQIPQEITEEILSRLPVKSLLRFRCVSKLWQTLISDPKFSLSPKGRERGLCYIKSKFQEDRTCFYSVDNELIVQELPPPLEKGLYGFNFEFHGSCNGLMLFIITPSIYIWNPATRHCREVLQLDLLAKGFIPEACGLCFDDSTDDYKVVIALKRFGIPGIVTLIRSLRSEEWLQISFPFRIVRDACYVHGHLHWIVEEEMQHTNRYGLHSIVYFDANKNEFKKFPVPDIVSTRDAGISHVRVVKGYLCMALICNSQEQLWIMKEYGVKESWTAISKHNPRWGDGFVLLPDCSLSALEALLNAKFRILLSMSLWCMNDLFNTFKGFDLPANNHLDDFSWETYFESLTSIPGIYSKNLGGEIRWSSKARP